MADGNTANRNNAGRWRAQPVLRAFTLLEVLTVIVVVGILASLTSMAVQRARTSAHRVQCASNLRQIGGALLNYATDNGGNLPQTAHSGDRQSGWLHTLLPYMSDSKAVRVCPADHYDRQQSILNSSDGATSYLLNENVFAPVDVFDENAPRYDNMAWIPAPSRTLFASISNRPVSATWDHSHSSSWYNLSIMASDVAVDIHGKKSGQKRKNTDRIDPDGDANYLYGDGHVANISVRELQSRFFSRGINPGEVPVN